MWCVIFLSLLIRETSSFTPSTLHEKHLLGIPILRRFQWTLKSNEFDDRDDPSNQYPELEFIDYSDPNYVVDQGSGDEFFPVEDDEVEAQIEEMREDRRRRNDEFQFETYFDRIHKNGDTFFGEWTIYKTSTFMDGVQDDEEGYPRLMRARKPLKVQSRAFKVSVPSDSKFRVDGERICHEDVIVKSDEPCNISKEASETEAEIIKTKFCPEQLCAFDFRGWQGIMCVGTSHTSALASPLIHGLPEYEGPFESMNTEIGIGTDNLRMRLKLVYSVKDEEKSAFLRKPKTATPPPLHLKSLIVCREAREKWPVNGMGMDVSEAELLESEILFGIPGAKGGLYDPPPVGGNMQEMQYMTLDLEGGATAFFPFLMQQDPNAHQGYGWVTSLDWSPGKMRYQVDRKVKSGFDLLALRTLELSEVQSEDASMYRPRDGGADMMQ